MLLCAKVTLEFEDKAQLYKDIIETVAYLNSVKEYIDKEVLDGAEIEGLEIETPKTRIITPSGMKYLEKKLGKDVMYKTTTKPIGITELSKLISQEEIDELVKIGGIDYKIGNQKVKVI